MQELIAGMDKEIADVRQQAIALRQQMLRIQALQNQASLDPDLQEQLTHLARSFERAKETLSAMEAKKKHLTDQMSKALTQAASGLADLNDFMTCVPLPEFRKPPQPLNIFQHETLDVDLETLKVKLDQL